MNISKGACTISTRKLLEVTWEQKKRSSRSLFLYKYYLGMHANTETLECLKLYLKTVNWMGLNMFICSFPVRFKVHLNLMNFVLINYIWTFIFCLEWLWGSTFSTTGHIKFVTISLKLYLCTSSAGLWSGGGGCWLIVDHCDDGEDGQSGCYRKFLLQM